ncbi:MAG: TIGR02757 family protein [Nitrospinota bacterium]
MRPFLKDRLEHLYRTFDVRYLSPDPLEIVHRYRSREDREVVGFVAAALAYGQVDQILGSVGRALALMEADGKTPDRFVRTFDPAHDGARFESFRHRFNRGEDLACLLYWMRQAIEEEGSLGGFFLRGYRPEEPDVGPALSRFVRGLLSLDRGRFYPKGLPGPGEGVRFFLPSPQDGSACKRLALFLRWMVRRGDALDFGQWREVSAAHLVIPLDAHVSRIARYVGLTEHVSPSWRAALEVTERLRRFDPNDPVKYDFSLCRLGILKLCPKKRHLIRCNACPLLDVCLL